MNTQVTRYPIVEGIRLFSQAFDLDPARAMRRAGLPVDFLDAGARPVSATEYYDLWDAMLAERPSEDFVLRIGEFIDAKGFDSSVYSFFSSPDVRTGLQRKALLKPLITPLRMIVTDYEQHLALSFGSVVSDRSLPPLMGWFDLVYFVLAIRRGTGEPINPVAVQVEDMSAGWAGAETFFGGPITKGVGYRMVFKATDARRPLISRNDAQWEAIERGLQDQFVQAVLPKSMSARVRQALIDGLPGGQSTADQIAQSLALSKRSLQRRLTEEGSTFKSVLEDTRQAMALNYLRNTDMSVQEIAFLLGFRDPSSFFRAFRAWTGTTPQALRQQRS